MIKISDYEIFTNHISKLKETSIDKHNIESIEYMTTSQIDVINFDNVKYEYIKDLKLTQIPKSNDALYIGTDGKIIFIEFKNGYIDNEKQFAIRKKIYDSVLIFTDIVGIGISKMRQIVDYILVINETVNPIEATKMKKYIQPSYSYDKIAKFTGELGKEKYIPFGIRIFKNYCFRNVDVFTKFEFEKYLNDI